MCITRTLHTLKEIIYDNMGIIASVSQDGDEHTATWWDNGVLNSLSLCAGDYTAHYTQHTDGTLINEWHGAINNLGDEVVLEWYEDGARCAFSFWAGDSMALFVAHKNGELIDSQFYNV